MTGAAKPREGARSMEMSMLTVGVADMKLSDSSEDTLVTYALGSCAGIAIYDRTAGIAGILHCMLPLSKIAREKAASNPYMFVDTGIPELFRKAYELGARKERITVKVAGCAQILDDNGHFKIGMRNHAAVRKILWKNNILIEKEEVGGGESRTMYCSVATGRVQIKSKDGTRDI